MRRIFKFGVCAYIVFLCCALCGCTTNNIKTATIVKTNGDTLVFYGGRVYGDGMGAWGSAHMTLVKVK